jgi:branched-chain amino acid transport system permease protein
MDIVRVISKRSFVLGLLLLILILLATSPVYAPEYTVILLTSIFMYIIITVSWAMFSGPTGYISLAAAAFFGVGIYTSAILGRALPLPLVIGIGGLASFCLALFMLIIFAILMLTAYFIRHSKYGLALQSIGEYEEAAAHTGINVTALKIITFAISAFFIGATGAIMATRWTYIDPKIAFNPLLSFMPVLMAIFGGMGQLYGPVIGATIFTYLEEFLVTRLPYYYMLIFGIIMVVAILYLPDGLVGLVQKWRRRISGERYANT